MAAANKKSSRQFTQNQMRGLGIIRQSQENYSHPTDKFAIEGYAKKIVTSNSPSITDNQPIKKSAPLSAASNHASNSSNPSVNIDHSECSKSIDELKQQIYILKNENSQLDCELHAISLELTNWKSLNDKLQSDKSSLESTNEELKTQNQNLKENFQILSAEFVSERDQWLVEKQQLEKQLSEIRRELENKIIEIRQKHSDQVLGFEEKIRLLKNQLSDTLKMRSVERQFEIDRISKDLEKSQINEENLRNRLNKVMEKQNSNSQSELQLCENCRKPLKSKKPNDGMAEIRKEKLDVNKLFDVNDRWKPGAARSAENKH